MLSYDWKNFLESKKRKFKQSGEKEVLRKFLIFLCKKKNIT